MNCSLDSLLGLFFPLSACRGKGIWTDLDVDADFSSPRLSLWVRDVWVARDPTFFELSEKLVCTACSTTGALAFLSALSLSRSARSSLYFSLSRSLLC